jgi:hypothetical protein
MVIRGIRRLTAALILGLVILALLTVLSRVYMKYYGLLNPPNADWAFAVLGAGFFLIFVAGNLWPRPLRPQRT